MPLGQNSEANYGLGLKGSIKFQRSQGPNLTDSEQTGIDKLDGFAQENVDKGDQFEREFSVDQEGNWENHVGTKENPGGDRSHVDLPVGPGARLIGHTHTHGLNERFSVGDRSNFTIANSLSPASIGAQMLLRTPTGAIRSITRVDSGFHSETLRGTPISGYPLRGATP